MRAWIRATLAYAVLCSAPANAQAPLPAVTPPAVTQPVTQPADAAAAPRALAPFTADYQVLRGGRALGAATLRLVRQAGGQWRVDLTMRGTGLMGLAGINAEQSTVFESTAGTYRPLSQATRRSALFTNRSTVGTYDWPRKTARWTGDIKPARRRPVDLQPGDMSGLLINLAVVRDTRPGAVLEYRFVDDGRVRDHRYVAATLPEPVEVDGLVFDALRVSRAAADGEETAVWVAEGVPTPIRMLQREQGQDTYDLRLVQYKGAP